MPRLLRVMLLLVLGLTALPAHAENARTILVLDGSGSMWGQIEGENKIVIARRVVGDVLDALPDDLELGLTVYGHRRKGDCADIESVVAPAKGTREAIRKAVNGINPKGKTPLSNAVLAAAEELKYGEEVATVILVSDGRETCEVDPCELGRKLEETGVAFTAHVIGFDVSEESDRAQLRCLAENTGGTFLSASNASELSDALKEVSVAPAPPPPPATLMVSFSATEGEGGPRIADGLIWTVTAVEADEPVVENTSDAALLLELTQKLRYRAEVLRTSDEATAEQEFTTGSAGPREVVLVLDPPPLPEATVTGPEAATVGSTVDVEWTGPDARNDFVSIARTDAEPGKYENYAYTKDGSPLKLLMPSQPGAFEIRYVLSDGKHVLARQPVTVEQAEVSLSAPETATVGSTVSVEWVGPDARNDFISIAATDQEDGKYVNYSYTREGSPLKLLMPPAPGDYEIRYVLNQDKTVMARKPITIEEAKVSVSAPATATVGSTVSIEWIGPDAQSDYISIAAPGEDDNRYVNYTYTREGSPLKLLMPSAPGDYEIRYVLNQGKTVMARTPITIEQAEVSISAPEKAEMGSTIQVEWIGPDAQSDYISIAAPGEDDNRYVNYTYTREGSPLKLLMPPAPGDYEIRYVLNQDKTVMARTPITIEQAEVSVSAPEQAEQSTTVLVDWTGPDAQSDFISVAEIGSEANAYVNYTYTREGAPLKLEMPPTPGDYEIRYILNQDKSILARQPIRVDPAEVSLDAKDSVKAEGKLAIEWTGPDGNGDYIAIALPGKPGGDYLVYQYTRSGSPVLMQAPQVPSKYEIRYVLGRTKEILARKPLTVE